ncbi:metallophosphoesterase family protein [Lentzea sp. NPDC051838]|uniref:purple acid phosphatase family protein n=1 Tax=Lentzea sp. NPDC051838 TaxID=3154849 RepID=UPI003441873E
MTDTTRRSLFKVLAAATAPAEKPQKNRPVGRHLAFGADPSKQVVISWQQLEKVNGPYVRIATDKSNFGPPISAELRTLKSEIKWQEGDHSFPPHGPDPMYQHYLHVKLDDLTPNTTYFYVVGHQDYEQTDVATFRTAPTTNTGFTFTAFGDQGYGYNARKLNSLAKDQNPAFHLALGNLSYAIHGGTKNAEGGHPDTDKYDAARWNSLFAQNEPLAANTPWMITLGNREMEEWYSPNGYGGAKARFTMPDNAWSGSTGIYAWRYQNVGLISLDGNDICNRNAANLDYTKGKQLTWLNRQLADFRGDPKIDFIVVYLHHSTYSTGEGGAESIAQQKWAPVFDKYQVDLVLSAHNRVYERTDPIKAGKPATKGTTYITAGGGGQALDKFYKDVPTMRCFKKNSDKSTDTKVTWSRMRYRGYGITVVDVAAKTMKIRALDEDGGLIDEITLQR